MPWDKSLISQHAIEEILIIIVIDLFQNHEKMASTLTYVVLKTTVMYVRQMANIYIPVMPNIFKSVQSLGCIKDSKY